MRDHPLITVGLGLLGRPYELPPYRLSYAQVTAGIKLGRPAVGVHWRENAWLAAAARLKTMASLRAG